MVLLKLRKEFARRPYTTLSEISDFMKVTARRESRFLVGTGSSGSPFGRPKDDRGLADFCHSRGGGNLVTNHPGAVF
jgi:hypothetical protein